MQNTEAKRTRMYPLVNTGTASKKGRQKENKNKAKRRRSKREEKNCERVFYLVTHSCALIWNQLIVDHVLLNKDAVANLGKRDLSHLKLLLTERKTCSQRK